MNQQEKIIFFEKVFKKKMACCNSEIVEKQYQYIIGSGKKNPPKDILIQNFNYFLDYGQGILVNLVEKLALDDTILLNIYKLIPKKYSYKLFEFLEQNSQPDFDLIYKYKANLSYYWLQEINEKRWKLSEEELLQKLKKLSYQFNNLDGDLPDNLKKSYAFQNPAKLNDKNIAKIFNWKFTRNIGFNQTEKEAYLQTKDVVIDYLKAKLVDTPNISLSSPLKLIFEDLNRKFHKDHPIMLKFLDILINASINTEEYSNNIDLTELSFQTMREYENQLKLNVALSILAKVMPVDSLLLIINFSNSERKNAVASYIYNNFNHQDIIDTIIPIELNHDLKDLIIALFDLDSSTFKDLVINKFSKKSTIAYPLMEVIPRINDEHLLIPLITEAFKDSTDDKITKLLTETDGEIPRDKLPKLLDDSYFEYYLSEINKQLKHKTLTHPFFTRLRTLSFALFPVETFKIYKNTKKIINDYNIPRYYQFYTLIHKESDKKMGNLWGKVSFSLSEHEVMFDLMNNYFYKHPEQFAPALQAGSGIYDIEALSNKVIQEIATEFQKNPQRIFFAFSPDTDEYGEDYDYALKMLSADAHDAIFYIAIEEMRWMILILGLKECYKVDVDLPKDIKKKITKYTPAPSKWIKFISDFNKDPLNFLRAISLTRPKVQYDALKFFYQNSPQKMKAHLPEWISEIKLTKKLKDLLSTLIINDSNQEEFINQLLQSKKKAVKAFAKTIQDQL